MKESSQYMIDEKLRKILRNHYRDEPLFCTLGFFLGAVAMWIFVPDSKWLSIGLLFVALLWLLLAIPLLRTWFREEQFRYGYELDDSGIRQLRASGAVREGRWDDLAGVHWTGADLFFETENKGQFAITVNPLFETPASPLAESIRGSIESVGKAPLLRKAKLEYVTKHHKDIEAPLKTPLWRWHFYGQCPALIFLFTYVALPADVFPRQKVFLWASVILSVAGFIIVRTLWQRQQKALRVFDEKQASIHEDED